MDRVLTATLTVLHVTFAVIALAVTGLFAFVVAPWSCAAGDESDFCSTGGGVTFAFGVIVGVGLLVAGLVVSSTRRRRARAADEATWPWPLLGLGMGALGVVIVGVTAFGNPYT